VQPSRFVSAGRLPPAPDVALASAEVHERLAADHSGSLSTVYPVLADPDLFGLSVVSVTGQVPRTGDADVVFPS
jgi:glutaminase